MLSTISKIYIDIIMLSTVQACKNELEVISSMDCSAFKYVLLVDEL